MSVKIKVRCHYIDCKFLDGLYCSASDIEIDPKKFCLTYLPIEPEEVVDDDLLDDEEENLEEEELEWDELAEEDDWDDDDKDADNSR